MIRSPKAGRDAPSGLDPRTFRRAGTGPRGGKPMSNPQAKQMRRAYGFDEVAIVPGDATVNPAMTEISLRIDHLEFALPFLAAAMDAVVDPKFAIGFGQQGGLA